jgi:hypothetical protein
MRLTRSFLGAGVCLALAGNLAGAAEPATLPAPISSAVPADSPAATPPATLPSDGTAVVPEIDACTEVGESCKELLRFPAPTMFGDVIGKVARIERRVTTPVPGSSTLLRTQTTLRYVPLLSDGAFKIAENESPQPQDRLFFNYNYFNNVFGSLPVLGGSSPAVHREIIGFEKTFFDNNFSFGLRLPFLQIRGDQDFDDSQVGNLTFIGKYALINNADTGNVLSGGLVLTVPTGDDFVAPSGQRINATLLQPFIGAVHNVADRLYVHGFTSLAVATESSDVTVLFNDVGMGYWVWRRADDRLIRGLVPTAEFHVNTPLNHRGVANTPPSVVLPASASPPPTDAAGVTSFSLQFPDIVNVTGGVHVLLRGGSTLGVAIAVPLTGPQPFDYEVLANLNWRF